MRGLKLSLWIVCAVLLCVSISEAGRFRATPGCSGGACAVPAEPAPAPAPEVATVPPVVTDGAIVTSEISVEVRRPVVRAAVAPVRAVAALAGAIRNREHKPVVRAVRAIVGHHRRAERRGR